ncbi:MAG TPA: hypothetical protein VLA13_05505, partial [Massilibacterium sp.]|nr:hypothetical protein [Massilibacterium sp.]
MRETIQKPFGRDQLINELKKEFERLGDTRLDVYDKKRKDHLPASHIVRRKLGNATWPEVLEICDFQGHYTNWSKEKVLQILNSKNRQLTFKEMKELNIKPHTVNRYFGSYKKLHRELNWEYTEKEFYTDVTNDELKKEYDNVCRLLGKTATTKEINEHSIFSFEVYRGRFGSINELRRVTGYDHYKDPRTITKDECMREMLLIYEKHGRVTYDRLHDILPFHYRTLLRKFGTTSIKD